MAFERLRGDHSARWREPKRVKNGGIPLADRGGGQPGPTSGIVEGGKSPDKGPVPPYFATGSPPSFDRVSDVDNGVVVGSVSEVDWEQFEALPVRAKIRYVGGLQYGLEDDTRVTALRTQTIREALELPLDDPKRAGIVIIGSHYGNHPYGDIWQDGYSISVITNDTDGTPLCVAADRNLVVDAFAPDSEDNAKQIGRHINRRMEDVGEWQPAQSFVRYNRFLEKLRATFEDSTAPYLRRETYLRHYFQILKRIKLPGLLRVELDHDGMPSQLSISEILEDPEVSASKLRDNRDGNEGLTATSDSHTIDVSGLSPDIKWVIIKTLDDMTEDQTRRENPTDDHPGTVA